MRGGIGESVRRLDADTKASGNTKYLDDLPFGGLHAVVVRSPVAAGTINRVVYDSAFDWSDVVMVDYRDIPGTNINPMLKDDQPFLAEAEVRFVGEPVLLLAHPDKRVVEQARRHVTIECEETRPLLTLDEALAAKQRIYGDDNCFTAIRVEKGDAAGVFAEEKYRIIEGTYETGYQEQLYMEPQSMAAYWRGGDIKVVGSMQCPGYLEGALAALTGREVEVEQSPTGGAFGGKEDYPSLMAAYVWLLCHKAKRDVKLVYDRSEDIAFTTKRHPARLHYRTAVDATGRLRATEVTFLIDGGAYATLSPVVLSRGVVHCTGLYDIPNVSVTGKAMATNTPPNGAFRGFGAPQAIFGIERHMDEIAAALGLSPQRLRERNLPQSGFTILTGAPLAETEELRGLFREALRRSEFEKRRVLLEENNRREKVKRGIGLALFMHGGGFTGGGEAELDSRVKLTLLETGEVEIRVYSVEMGQGAITVLSQRVADALQIPLPLVRYAAPNTRKDANSGPTVASRTTMVIGGLLEEAAGKLKGAVGTYGDAAGFVDAVRRYCGTDKRRDFGARFRQPETMVWDEEHYRGQPYLNYSLGCYVAEVSVDPVTLRVSVTRFDALSDIGRPVNPTLAKSQVQGGVIQALGYALQEEVIYRGGRVASARLSDYMIPIAGDIPQMNVGFVARDEAIPKGLGELPMDGPAAAIANAVSHALGIPFNTLPVTAETITEALHDH